MSTGTIILIAVSLLMVGLIIAATAYSRTVGIINKYKDMDCKINARAIDFAAKCIEVFNLNIKIALTDKELGDAYVPNKKILVISKQMADSRSISAISVVSHEIGHAIQDKNKKVLLKLDIFFRKLYSFFKFLIFPIFISGIILLFFPEYELVGLILLISLLGIWVLSIITRLITIPMEYEASKIAYNMLKDNRVLTRAELKITKKILKAAALTYVAALFINVLNLLRRIKYSFRS